MSHSPCSGVVTAHCCEQRFDKTLARLFPQWSRRQLKRLLVAGQVRINGSTATRSTRAHIGDRVELRPPGDPHRESPHQDDIDLLHESENFVYVYKPSGEHVVAHYPGQPGTLATRIARVRPDCAAATLDPRDGGAIHRLDQATSGIVAVAKHGEAYLAGRAAMSRRTARKLYLAVLQAEPRTRSSLCQLQALGLADPLLGLNAADFDRSELTWPNWHAQTPTAGFQICAPLGHGPQRNLVGVSSRGRPAITTMLTLAHNHTQPRLRLALLRLHTGARHQLRAHMAAIGLPILHDALYGPASNPSHRLALHAWCLDLHEADPRCGPIHAPVRADFMLTAAPEPPEFDL